MRHRKTIKKFGRKRGPRKALLMNLAASVILYEKVKTTETKAKVIRSMVERLVTRGKVNTLHNRRMLEKVLPEKNSVKKVLEVLGPRYKERKGGYLRITKLGHRAGDAAPMAQIEFV